MRFVPRLVLPPLSSFRTMSRLTVLAFLAALLGAAHAATLRSELNPQVCGKGAHRPRIGEGFLRRAFPGVCALRQLGAIARHCR